MIPVEEADVYALWLASMGGVAQLAHELEQQHLITESDSLDDARRSYSQVGQEIAVLGCQ